jgi:hypothetical protein
MNIVRMNVPIDILRKSLFEYLLSPAFKPFLDHLERVFYFKMWEWVTLQEIDVLWEVVPVFDDMSQICMRLASDIGECLYLGFWDAIYANGVWTFVIDPD